MIESVIIRTRQYMYRNSVTKTVLFCKPIVSNPLLATQILVGFPASILHSWRDRLEQGVCGLVLIARFEWRNPAGIELSNAQAGGSILLTKNWSDSLPRNSLTLIW